jgi:hypothetical protein
VTTTGAIETAGPVFVGGSPRSGTHIVAHLLASHSRYALVRQEVGFHCNARGVPGFVRGRIEKDQLVQRIRERWWPRFGPTGGGGLEGVVSRETVEAALERFLVEDGDDRKAPSARLVRSILDPVAAAAGKPLWVEKSLQNVQAAPVLTWLMPAAKVIHVVRDGRDVACSLAGVSFGPDSRTEALRRWATRVRTADASAREAPAGTVLTLQLEDLVLYDRDASYRRLLDFLALPDEKGTRAFFETELTAERAHVGRWRAELSAYEQTELTQHYEAILTRMRNVGVSCAPPERPGGVSHGVRAREPANPYDPFAGTPPQERRR